MAEFTVYKMRRKIAFIALFLGIALTSWIYWKRNTEFNETVIILKKKLHRLKDVSRQPHIVKDVSRQPHIVKDVSRQPHIVKDVSRQPHIVKDVSRQPHIVKDVSRQPHTVKDVSRQPHTVKDISRQLHTVKDFSLPAYAIEDVTLQLFPATCTSNLFLVIIVTSYVGHVELRNAHRKAAPAEILREVNATRVFLLAQIPDNETYINQSAINDESKTFGDILQGTFVENYRNLTYKHLMGLKWASTICQGASFILKVDDDTVYILGRTYAILESVDNSTALLMGYINNITLPARNKTNKWYVTWDEYPRREYPPFLSGWYYITTPQVAAALCEEAIYYPYFWIDDIFVTGLLPEALGMKLTALPPETFWADNFLNCDYDVGLKQYDCRI